MHDVTEFYDLTNAAVIGWNAAVKRACDIQPTSRPDLLTADDICRLTGLLPLYPFNVPEGYVATGPMSIEVIDGAAYKRYDTITIEAHEAGRNQLAQTRILGLVDAYGADIAIMGRLLGDFQFTLPCDPANVINTIKVGLATGVIDWEKRTDADTLEQRYLELKKVMTDAEIAAVAAILEARQ